MPRPLGRRATPLSAAAWETSFLGERQFSGTLGGPDGLQVKDWQQWDWSRFFVRKAAAMDLSLKDFAIIMDAPTAYTWAVPERYVVQSRFASVTCLQAPLREHGPDTLGVVIAGRPLRMCTCSRAQLEAGATDAMESDSDDSCVCVHHKASLSCRHSQARW